MGQIIPAASGDNAQNKTFEFSGLVKVTGASGDRIKIADAQSGKDEENENNLVPFLQFLNQQMSRANEYSDNDSGKLNEANITMKQAMSLRQDDVQELYEALNNPASFGETAGDVNPLLVIDPEQANSQKASSENDAVDALTVTTNKGLKEKSDNNKNEVIMINDQNVTLNPPGVIILETPRNNLLQGDEFSAEAPIKMSETVLNNTACAKVDGVKADDVGFPSQPEKEAVDDEIKFNAKSKEKESALKSSENTVQQQKINFSKNPDQLAQSVTGRVGVDLAEIDEESKTNKNNETSILPLESAKEDSVDVKNFHSIIGETKESQIGKDKLHFSEKQQRPDTVTSNTGNKSQTEVRIISGEVSDYIKTGQKEKNISNEKSREEISLVLNIATGGASTGNEKINDVNADRIVGRITTEIKDAAANDGGRVKIALNPPSLGKLEMDVTVRNGKVEVILVADNKDVQQTLSTHIEKLKGGLQNQGLTIDRCDVFMQGNRDEYQQNFSRQNFYQDSGSQQNKGRQPKPEEKVTAGTIISKRPGTALGISIDNISLFA